MLLKKNTEYKIRLAVKSFVDYCASRDSKDGFFSCKSPLTLSFSFLPDIMLENYFSKIIFKIMQLEKKKSCIMKEGWVFGNANWFKQKNEKMFFLFLEYSSVEIFY
jgi:hypothetical protein